MNALSNNFLNIERLNFENELENFIIRAYFILLSFTALMSVFDQIPLFSGSFTSLANVGIFPAFKFIKDLMVVILFFSLLPLYLYRANSKSVIGFLALFVFILISAIYTVIQNREIYVLAGFRWILPVAIIYLLSVVDVKKIEKPIVMLMVYLLIVNFSTQIYQLIFMPHWFGTTDFGMSKRVMGIFMAPNTSAFFSCGVLAYALYKKEELGKINLLIVALVSILSISLTKSGTGILSLMILLTILFFPIRYMLLGFAFLAITLPLVIFNLDTILNRENYLALSGVGRLRIMYDAFQNIGFISNEFGYHTNTTNLLYTMLEPGKIFEANDSIVASIQGNLGYIGTSIYAASVIVFFTQAVYEKNKGKLSILAVLVIFGMTTVSFEVFPMIYMLPLLFRLS
ncbi:hypothetical protein [Enterovibrio norvegicus]|uniref:hypothetical protein n=1 Tax=Enterovibrio norvegicus TaxID=188144 RepID=UPI00354C80D0